MCWDEIAGYVDAAVLDAWGEDTLVEAIRDGVLNAAMDIQHPIAWVTPADIATVAAGRLLSRAWSGRLDTDMEDWSACDF